MATRSSSGKPSGYPLGNPSGNPSEKPSGEAVRRGKQLRSSMLAACAVCIASAAFAICMAFDGAAFGMSALDVFQPETAWADLVAGEAVAQGEFAPQAQVESAAPALGTQAEGSLEFLGFTGTGVVGDAGSGYTLYVRDGDQASVTLTVKNTSGADLEHVTMVNASTYEEGGETVEPIGFPPYPYRSDSGYVTGATKNRYLAQTSETTGIGYYGYAIETGATAMFVMEISAGNLAAGTYNWNVQLGKCRYDYEAESADSWYWPCVGIEVEETYTPTIPLNVVIYRQDGAKLTVGQNSGDSYNPNINAPADGVVDFGTIDLGTASDADLKGERKLFALNASAKDVLTDAHGVSTSIKVSFSGEASYSPFTWGNGTLYDTVWDWLPPEVTSAQGGVMRQTADYTIFLDATRYIAGTYTGNLVVSTTPHSVTFNDQQPNGSGEYRIPFKVTLTGTNPRLLPRATNLTAKAGNGLVELTWAPAQGANEYTEYAIWRRDGTESQSDPDKLDWSAYEKVGSKAVGTDEELLFVDGDVENGKTYSYTVICGDPQKGYAAAPATATPDVSIASRMLAPDASAYRGLNCVHVSWTMSDAYGGEGADGAGMVDHFNVYRDGVLVDRIYRSAVSDDVKYGWHDDGTGTDTRVYGVTSHSYSWSVEEPVPELYTPYSWTVTAVSPSGVEGYASDPTSDYAYGEAQVIVGHEAWFDSDYAQAEGTGAATAAICINIEGDGNGDCIDELSFWRGEGSIAPDTSKRPYATAKMDYGYSSNAHDFADKNVTAGKTYTYAVQGTDYEGNLTNVYVFTVAAKEDYRFDSPDVAWGVVDKTTARLTWYSSWYYDDDNNLRYTGTYKVYRNGQLIQTLSGKDEYEFRDNPGVDGEYAYRVDAEIAGVTIPGRTFTFVRNTAAADEIAVLQVPGAPVLAGRTSGTSNVILSWAPATTGGAAEGYHIYRMDANDQVTGGRTVTVEYWNGPDNTWTSWGNGRYISIEDASELTFVDGPTSPTQSYYKDDPHLGEIKSLDWGDEKLPHTYWVTAYNRAGESEPSQVVVFDSHGVDKYDHPIAPANAAEEAPAAPVIQDAWVEWDDTSSRAGFASIILGAIRTSWTDVGFGAAIDSWTLSYAGTHYSGLRSSTLYSYQASLDAEAKLGTSQYSPAFTADARTGENGEVGRTIAVTVAATNAAGSAESDPVSLDVLSFPRTRVVAGNGKAAVEWTDLLNDSKTQVTSWEIWRKAEYGAWERVEMLDAASLDVKSETIAGSTTSYYAWTDEGLENGTAYQYKVVAKCVDGKERPGAVCEVTPTRTSATEAPGAPQNFKAEVVNGEVLFSWDAPITGDAPQYYEVHYKDGDVWPLAGSDFVRGDSLSYAWAPYAAGTYTCLVDAYSHIDGDQVPRHARSYESDDVDELFPSHSNIVEVTITDAQIGERVAEDLAKPLLNATPGDGTVALRWTLAGEGAKPTYFVVERERLIAGADSERFEPVTIAAGGDSWEFVDDTADANVKYRYYVWSKVASSSLAESAYVDVRAIGVTVADKARAAIVAAEIDALPDSGDLALSDADAVREARSSYDALSAAQQGLVSAEAVDKLVECEAKVQQLIDELAQADAEEAADGVIALVDAIPNPVTLEAERAIADARAAYGKVSDEAQAIVREAGKLEALENAEGQLELAKQAKENERVDLAARGAVTLSPASFAYDGTAKQPAVAVMVNGAMLALGDDFTVAYSNNVAVGTGYVTVTGIGAYKGTLVREFTISAPAGTAKKANPLSVVAKAKKVKAKKVKKKKQTVAPIAVRGAQGAVSYKVVGGNKKSKKALKVNAATGKITVKKKTKKGTYKVKVRVSAAGNAAYLAGAKDVTVTVKVK